MQESAWNHAEHLELGYSHLIKKNLAWVLARLSLQIEALPVWHENIIVRTFPSGRDKLFAYRDFHISSEQGNVLVLGTTTWFVIDINRRRPQRTDSYFHLNEWGEYDHAYHGFAAKVKALEEPDSISQRRVYYSDLDVNGHVNNVKYLEYILDSFALDFFKTHNLKQLDMNFLNEAFYEDRIEIRTQKIQENYVHSLFRDNGKTELCRAKTNWKKR
jgi:acyl-ACP thioesterase